MEKAQIPPVAREKSMVPRSLWSALDAAANPASTLAILAALVRTLSPADYGTLIIALAASGLSMAINPALAATTTKFVSGVSGDPQSIGRTLAGVITASLMTVAVIDFSLLFVTALFNESLSRWVFGATTELNVGRILLLAVLSIGIQQIDTVVAAAIRGLERFRRQALIELLSRVMLAAVVSSVAWATRSLEQILLAQCGVYLASTLIRVMALRRVLPNQRLFKLSAKGDSRAIFSYGGWMWLTALAGVAYTSADRIIIGRSIGPAAAGQFNIYVQITQLIHFIPTSLLAFSFPVFSRLAAQGHASRLVMSRAYESYLKAIGIAALGVAMALMLCWSYLMRALAGPGFSAGSITVPGLLAINFILLACNVIPYYVLLALGNAREVAVITTLSMLAALGLMAVLIPRYGLEGAAISRLAYGVGTLMLLHRARRLMRRT